MTIATADDTQTQRLDESRRRVAEIDDRMAEIDARLAAIPDEEHAIRLAVARGQTKESAARRKLATLANEAYRLGSERAELLKDRDAATLVLGERQADAAEREAVAALEAGAEVQARIEWAWSTAGERMEQLVASFKEIVAAEVELAALRDQVAADNGRRAALASPSDPLPANFYSFLDRLYDASVDPRQLGRTYPLYGVIGAVLPDLSSVSRLPAVHLPDVTPYQIIR